MRHHQPTSPNRLTALGLLLVGLTQPTIAEDVPDTWIDDEIAVHFTIASQDEDTTPEDDYPDWEDEEIAQQRIHLDAQPAAGDLDIFTITLTVRATVHVETLGKVDTYGHLMDERGLDIATDDDSGTESNFRIITTLDPGRYLLGVARAPGSIGPYSLKATLNQL